MPSPQYSIWDIQLVTEELSVLVCYAAKGVSTIEVLSLNSFKPKRKITDMIEDFGMLVSFHYSSTFNSLAASQR